MTNADQKAFSKVQKKYEASEDKVESLHRKFNRLEDLYFNHLRKSQKSAKSNAFTPLGFEVVERMVSTLFAADPRGNYVGLEPGDERAAAILDSLVDYQWNRPGQNMLRKLQDMGRTAGVFGTAFGFLGWKYERRFVENKKREDGEKGDFVTTWDDWYLQPLNIYDCYPDMSASNPGDMEYFIFDEYKTIEQLEVENFKYRGQRKYENLNELKEAYNGDTSSSSPNSYRQNAANRMGVKRDKTDGNTGRILIRNYFDKKEFVTVAPDFAITLSRKKNPVPEAGLPIVTLRDYDYPGLLYGRGEIEPVQSLIVAQNQFLNMALDNIKLSLQKPMVTTKDNLKHRHTWKWGQGAVFIEEKPGDLRTLEFPTGYVNVFNNISNDVKDTIAKSLGQLDFLSRNETAGSRTATEIKAMAGEQNARMRYKQRNIDMMLKDLYTKVLQYNQKFLSKDKLVRIVGQDAIDSLKMFDDMTGRTSPTGLSEDGKLKEVEGTDFAFLQVDPEDIAGVFDYQVESGSTRAVDVNNEVQNYTMALNTLGGVSQALEAKEGVSINLRPIVEELMLKLDIKNLDRIFESVEAQNEELNILGTPNGREASAIPGAAVEADFTQDPQFGGMGGL
jgi:hypothetical protein